MKLGVFLSNSKSTRGKLAADRLQALADLGLDWAGRSGCQGPRGGHPGSQAWPLARCQAPTPSLGQTAGCR